MKMPKTPRSRILTTAVFVLSLTVLIVNPISSAFAESNQHYSSLKPIHETVPKTKAKNITLLCYKGRRVLKVIGIVPNCPVGYKKSPILTPTPTSSPSSTPVPTPTPTAAGTNFDSSGTYDGTKSWQGINAFARTECDNAISGNGSLTFTLSETSAGKITGKITSSEGSIFGTRTGNTLTVKIQNTWGIFGPYSWQLNANTITGPIQVICIGSTSNALLAQGVANINVTRIPTTLTPTPTPTSTPVPTPTPAFNGTNVDINGTYTGTKSWQGVNAFAQTECDNATSGSGSITFTLSETSDGKIANLDGSISGTRDGNTITVKIQNTWGTFGPYTWQLNGNTITGPMQVLCISNTSNALLAQGVANINVART